MKKNNSSQLIFIIIILLLFIGIGYAYLNANLSLSGTANINQQSWNIYWDNLQVESGSVTDVTTPAVIKPNNTEVEFSITLSKPGDYYAFTVDAVNDGSIDAMISVITQGVFINNGETQIALPEYLEYEVTYSDGVTVRTNHLLEAGTSETYRVMVSYKRDITASQLPSTTNEYVFKFGVTYTQKDDNAIPIRTTIYNISNTETEIGEPLPNITTYDNYQDAITALGAQTFLRQVIGDGKVISTDAGFVVNNVVYYIKTSIEEEDGVTPVYNANRAILLEVFGQENCDEWSNGDYRNINCYSSADDMGAFAATDGHVETGNSTCGCYAHGHSYCYC